MAFAYCLHCGGRIYLGAKPWVGQPAFCELCDADMEVTSVSPLELDWSDYVAEEDLQEDELALDLMPT
jgi:hypothetical protein